MLHRFSDGRSAALFRDGQVDPDVDRLTRRPAQAEARGGGRRGAAGFGGIAAGGRASASALARARPPVSARPGAPARRASARTRDSRSAGTSEKRAPVSSVSPRHREISIRSIAIGVI
jgi:hypothetical protein